MSQGVDGGFYSSLRTMDRWPRICLSLISLEVFTNTTLSIKKSKDLELRSHHDHSEQAPERAPKLRFQSVHLPRPTLSTIAVVWTHVFPMSEPSHRAHSRAEAGARELDKPAPRTGNMKASYAVHKMQPPGALLPSIIQSN